MQRGTHTLSHRSGGYHPVMHGLHLQAPWPAMISRQSRQQRERGLDVEDQLGCILRTKAGSLHMHAGSRPGARCRALQSPVGEAGSPLGQFQGRWQAWSGSLLGGSRGTGCWGSIHGGID